MNKVFDITYVVVGWLKQLKLYFVLQGKKKRINILMSKYSDVEKLIEISDIKKVAFKPLDVDKHIKLCVDWLLLIKSSSDDGGIPANYRLLYREVNPIAQSYPETSGYILSTLIAWSKFCSCPIAKSIEDVKQFLLSQQLSNGGFRSGHGSMSIDMEKPLYFDAGQILLGLCSYYREVKQEEGVKGSILHGMSWMKNQINNSGKVNQRNTYSGNKAYLIRSTYGLLQASLLFRDEEGISLSQRHADWVISQQRDSGCIVSWGFNLSISVLHTITYTLRGLLELGMLLERTDYIDAVQKSVSFILRKKVSWSEIPVPPSHFFADGSTDDTVCPTGLAQLAIILYKLLSVRNNLEYREYVDGIMTFLKTVHLRSFDNDFFNGSFPGSWPISGAYQPYCLLNWASKFFLDALLLEKGIEVGKIAG